MFSREDIKDKSKGVISLSELQHLGHRLQVKEKFYCIKE